MMGPGGMDDPPGFFLSTNFGDTSKTTSPIQILLLTSQRRRIPGNAEEQPGNVSATLRVNGRGRYTTPRPSYFFASVILPHN